MKTVEQSFQGLLSYLFHDELIYCQPNSGRYICKKKGLAFGKLEVALFCCGKAAVLKEGSFFYRVCKI